MDSPKGDPTRRKGLLFDTFWYGGRMGRLCRTVSPPLDYYPVWSIYIRGERLILSHSVLCLLVSLFGGPGKKFILNIEALIWSCLFAMAFATPTENMKKHVCFPSQMCCPCFSPPFQLASDRKTHEHSGVSNCHEGWHSQTEGNMHRSQITSEPPVLIWMVSHHLCL